MREQQHHNDEALGPCRLLDAATASLQRRDEQSGGEMGRGEEEWPMEGDGFKARQGWARLGAVGQHWPGSGSVGRAVCTSRADKRSREGGPVRGREKREWEGRWVGPPQEWAPAVKERGREKSMTCGPRSIKSNSNYLKSIQISLDSNRASLRLKILK
jgi:hypothetical protein